MRFLALLITLMAATIPVYAQVEFVTDNYFPADQEFIELQSIISEKLFSDPALLSKIDNGQLIADVGFKDYAQQEYAVRDSGRVLIEIVTLIDYRAAFSLLSLLRSSNIHEDAFGDAYTVMPGNILFCHGKRWVRIYGPNISEALLRRIATSVSNRMGVPRRKFPSLISYLPEDGLQPDSLKYFPGIKTFETFHSSSSEGSLAHRFEMEIARAHYTGVNVSGKLSLLKFPTTDLAEDYFSYLSSPEFDATGDRTFFNMSGPLLSVLEGSFHSKVARKILDSIQYGYSVQWIRDNQAQHTIVWGIPVHILNVTVYSFFLVLMLCTFSILTGGVFGSLRLLLRRFVPKNPLDNPERTEITRLKLL